MPCYQRRTVTVELEAANKDLLFNALDGLGFQVKMTEIGITAHRGLSTSIFWDSGTKKLKLISSSNRAELPNEVKRAYAVESVKYASKKFGWVVKQTAANKCQATRRAWK